MCFQLLGFKGKADKRDPRAQRGGSEMSAGSSEHSHSPCMSSAGMEEVVSAAGQPRTQPASPGPGTRLGPPLPHIPRLQGSLEQNMQLLGWPGCLPALVN